MKYKFTIHTEDLEPRYVFEDVPDEDIEDFVQSLADNGAFVNQDNGEEFNRKDFIYISPLIITHIEACACEDDTPKDDQDDQC